jgi:multidrug resistance efflux pump
VIERNVNTGDSVKKGARLAALDPVPFDLAVKDARGPRQRRGAASILMEGAS